MLFVYIAGHGLAAIWAHGREGGPAGIARNSFLISNPANIRADVAEAAGSGLEFGFKLPGSGPIVVVSFVDGARFACAAVIAAAAVGTIVPDFKKRTVVG